MSDAVPAAISYRLPGSEPIALRSNLLKLSRRDLVLALPLAGGAALLDGASRDLPVSGLPIADQTLDDGIWNRADKPFDDGAWV